MEAGPRYSYMYVQPWLGAGRGGSMCSIDHNLLHVNGDEWISSRSPLDAFEEVFPGSCSGLEISLLD